MWSVSVWYKQHSVREVLVAEKESERNIHKHHLNLYGSAVIDRSIVGCSANRVMASETGKAEFHAMPR
jgi:hypothetical protein